MRRLLACGLAAAVLIGFTGCEGEKLKPGVPENVDFTKSYKPPAEVPLINPKDAAKATAASKAVPSTGDTSK